MEKFLANFGHIHFPYMAGDLPSSIVLSIYGGIDRARNPMNGPKRPRTPSTEVAADSRLDGQARGSIQVRLATLEKAEMLKLRDQEQQRIPSTELP
jgi:hypothetical protein